MNTAAVDSVSSLATPGQHRAERLALQLLAEPEVLARLKEARSQAAHDPRLQRPGLARRLEAALQLWASSLILREAAGDPEAPEMLWVGDTTPRTWFGHAFPGAALAGDNPDTIYRHAFIDGTAIYELVGRFSARPPTEFSIEPLPGVAGVIPASGTLTGKIGTTGGPALLTDRDVRCDPDGRFRILLGGARPADGVLHLPMPPEPMAINVRDVLADWTQQPVELHIRRLSPPRAGPLTEADLRERVLEHLPAYLRHWLVFSENWLGGIAPNTFKGPFGREGAWSYILAGRFALQPGEAAILSARPGGAGYHGCQVTDPWQVTLDNIRHQASLNGGQAVADADGWVSYVISPEDPGVANWLDTAGLREGMFLMRWQLFGREFDAEGVVRGYEIVPLSEVRRRTSLAQITPDERARRLGERARAYATRFRNGGAQRESPLRD